jgi:hypothetical protein
MNVMFQHATQGTFLWFYPVKLTCVIFDTVRSKHVNISTGICAIVELIGTFTLYDTTMNMVSVILGYD